MGGSVIAPNGIDADFLKSFKKFVTTQIRNKHRFIIVIGGGGIARSYQRAAKELTTKTKAIELDTLGMRATRLNAELVRVMLDGNRERMHPTIIDSPERLLYVTEPIAIAAGWMPGYSTDTVAVRIAEETNASRVIVAGHPPYVYNKDFKTHTDAKPLKKLTWEEYGKLISNQWSPGMAVPVDPIASKRAERMGITAIVTSGTNLENFEKLINDRPFEGTTIKPTTQ